MMKNKKTYLIVAAILFCIASLLLTIGMLAKLQHWSIASYFITIGMFVQLLSFILGGIALVLYLRKKK